MENQKRKQFQDPNLTAIAKKFMKLPPMIDLELDSPEKPKHINRFPGSIDNPFFSVRFTFGGRLHSVAYDYGSRWDCPDRLVDLCRFADAMALHLWKYRLRAAPVPGDEQFNYSLEDACGDIDVWEKLQPEYYDLMYEIENQLLFMGSITSPEEMARNWDASHKHSYAARRTAAGRLASEFDIFKRDTTTTQQMYFDGLASVMEEIQRLEDKMDRCFQQLRTDLGLPAALPTVPLRTVEASLPPITDKALASLPIVPEQPTIPPAHQAVLDNFHRRDDPAETGDNQQKPAVVSGSAIEPAAPPERLGAPATLHICRCDTPRPIWLFDHRLCSHCGWRYVAGKSQAGNFVANAPVWHFVRDVYCPDCGSALASDDTTQHCLSDSGQARRVERKTGHSCGYKIVLNETPTPVVEPPL